MFDKRDLISSFCLLVLGLLMAFQSLKMAVWSRSGPQEGFFPLFIAVIIIGLSLLIFLKSAILARAEKKETKKKHEESEVSFFRVFSYFILMLLYGLLIEKVGFLITSILFLILILKYMERQDWWITIVLGSASVIVGYFLFVSFLGVPLPRGLIKW
jgi:putative tricarboxylic transport membrane protein